MSDQTVKLDQEAVLALLNKTNPEPRSCAGLHPRIAQNICGAPINAEGINLGLELALHDYIKAEALPPQVAFMLDMYVPMYLKAILPDHPDLVTATLALRD